LRVPDLRLYQTKNVRGEDTLDFSNPEAVRTLNQSLVLSFPKIDFWTIPADHLCPAVPGRMDYLLHLNDLMPEGKRMVLDIGTGASCIYPLLGAAALDWEFVGTEINVNSVEFAEKLLEKNPQLRTQIRIRHQRDGRSIFSGVVLPREKFDFSMCNPPFHESREEALALHDQKMKNLGKPHEKHATAFGGVDSELWCEGGELGFLTRMIQESARIRTQITWFTTWVSRRESLGQLQHQLRELRAKQIEIPMEQGQKKTRILAWSWIA
jgi:23S rRNA (adenine1618-N6)-methyltransferase